MKKSQLLVVVCTLTLFALIGSADAAIIASDDTSITGTDQSYAPTLSISPSSFTSVDVPGGSGQIQPDEKFKFSDTSSESLRPDSHISLWLLLLVASVFGILSEAFHRGSFNR